MVKSSWPKDKVKEGSSSITDNPVNNTKKAIAQNHPTGSNAVPKRPRKIVIGTGSQSQTRKGDTPQNR
jgi:hypothetical protein